MAKHGQGTDTTPIGDVNEVTDRAAVEDEAPSTDDSADGALAGDQALGINNAGNITLVNDDPTNGTSNLGIDNAANKSPVNNDPTNGTSILGIDNATNETQTPVNDDPINGISITAGARDNKSSPAVALPLLDKLCSGMSVRELFLREYGDLIDEHARILRDERIASGEGTLNAAGIFQTVQKKLWLSLPSEAKEKLETKAQELNSNIQR